MNWIDYTIIAILALGAFAGFRKGLLQSVSNIICLVASVFIAKTYYKLVAEFLVANTAIEDKIGKYLSEKAFVEKMLLSPAGDSPVVSLTKNFSSDLNSFMTVLIINAISVLLVFLAARLVLGIAENFLVGVVAIPGIREVNSLGGAIIGLAKNIILIMLAFTVITPVSALKPLAFVAEGMKSSVFAEYFNTYNFILGWIWTAALDFLNK